MGRKHVEGTKIDSEVLLNIFFDRKGRLIKKIIEPKKVIFFEIHGLETLQCIEKDLSKYVKDKNLNLISNKRKPLVLCFTYLGEDSWELSVLQIDANGDIFFFNESTSKLSREFFTICKLIELEFVQKQIHRELLVVSRKLDSKMREDVFLLLEEDLKIFLERNALTTFEKRQVRYTFRYFNKMHDDTPEYIDDLTQHNNAIKRNREFKPVLDACEEVFQKHGFGPKD